MSKNFSVILGDNPFFGVNHLSHELARKKAEKSQSFENICKVMEYCSHNGVNKMMVSTHPQIKNLLDYLESNTEILKKFEFYPNIPYVQGYVTKVNEKGLMNTLFEILNSTGFKNKIKILSKGGLGILKHDFNALFKLLLDVELISLKKCNFKTVFLHDVITDLALSLNQKKIFQIFSEHIENNHDAKIGVVTKNFPLLISKLKQWDLDVPHIMTSFNKAGFQMNPSRISCENALTNCNSKIIAMSVLAGGYYGLGEAYDYISKIDQINTVVIGMSSIEHAKETLAEFC